MTGLKKLLAAVLLVAAGCSSKTVQSDSGTECDLTAGLRGIAGNDAIDCGYAVVGTDASPVDACVVSAFASGTAFLARYDRQGIDSQVVFGIAGDVDGQVTFLLWDGDPSGGSGAAPVISGLLCTAPSVDSSPMRDPFATPPVTCTSITSVGRTCG